MITGECLSVIYVSTLPVLLHLNANWNLECKLVAWILVCIVAFRDSCNKLSALPTGVKFVSEFSDYLILSKNSSSWFRLNAVHII